jgi:hypothetical protein
MKYDQKYDDASWHYGGDFPADLPKEAGATHTGMYLAWALLAGLAGRYYVDEFPEDISKLRERSVTPGRFFLSSCDGKFGSEALSDEGNAFTLDYFADFEQGRYLIDYEKTFDRELPDSTYRLYYVADTWVNFDKLRPTLDQRLAEWRAAVTKAAQPASFWRRLFKPRR